MDPEILDPERPSGQPAQQSADDLVALTERAFKGRVVKTNDVGHIEIAGPAGAIEIVRTPFATLAAFRGIRVPIPPEKDAALDVLTRLATGALVVVEEHAMHTLRRTHLVRVLDGRLHSIEDTTNDREDVPPKDTVYVVSFPAGRRDASSGERRFIAREMGGFMGRLKRKVVETIFDKAMGAVEAAARDASAPSGPAPDDGRRQLK